MVNRKHLEIALKRHIKYEGKCVYKFAEECPYVNGCKEGNRFQLEKDMLELITPVPPQEDWDDLHGKWIERCGACDAVLIGKPCYCSFCGTEVER